MLSQAGRQVTVQFNHREVAQTLHQGLCQRRQAGSDFDHRLPWQGCDRVNDGFNNEAISQKMLAEALAGNMFAVFHVEANYCGGARIST